MRLAAGLGMLAATLAARPVPAARADHAVDAVFPTSVLLGPVAGVTWGHGKRRSGLIGVEGGVGFNLSLYANAGVTYRAGEAFGYVEADGWKGLGATAGVGYGARRGVQPVLGVWEAIPLNLDCSKVVSISVGYRWTGVHELYVAAKGGRSHYLCEH